MGLLERDFSAAVLVGMAGMAFSVPMGPRQSFFPARSAITEGCENALERYPGTVESFSYTDILECV